MQAEEITIVCMFSKGRSDWVRLTMLVIIVANERIIKEIPIAKVDFLSLFKSSSVFSSPSDFTNLHNTSMEAMISCRD